MYERGSVSVLILKAVLLYFFAGVMLFAFLPGTADYIHTKDRTTVTAKIISVEKHTRARSKVYCVTMEYVLDGVTYSYTKDYKDKPSGSTTELQLYARSDGHYEVWEGTSSNVLCTVVIPVGAAGYATYLLLCAARRRKEQAE